MNKRRINKLIKALKTEAAGKMFNMRQWANRPDGAREPKEAFKTKGDCGTSACIAGMAAIIDPKFFELEKTEHGYYITTKDGSETGESALAEWLDILLDDATDITSPHSRVWRGHGDKDIAHAINLLEAYRDGGIAKALELS